MVHLDPEAAPAVDTSVAVHLKWDDLHYVVDIPEAKKNGGPDKRTILNHVSGQIAPGELLAVMGPSGSGKTTLVNVLSQRIPKEVYSGTIEVNGHKPNSLFRRVVGYVTQDSAFFSSLTVRETLRYAARLRLPEEMAVEEKYRRVEDVIEQLDIGSCADSRVGDGSQGGISGGERRRLAIGVELLFDPACIMLDEPTSGLDSVSGPTTPTETQQTSL